MTRNIKTVFILVLAFAQCELALTDEKHGQKRDISAMFATFLPPANVFNRVCLSIEEGGFHKTTTRNAIGQSQITWGRPASALAPISPHHTGTSWTCSNLFTSQYRDPLPAMLENRRLAFD